MSNTLYRKYRPSSFSEIIGQEHIVQALSNAIKNDKAGQSYLFTGPRGTGKTTMARIVAKALNCEKPNKGNPCGKCQNCKIIGDGKSLDIFEIDAASNTGVENIRELRETIKLPPSKLKHKVYIIDEVHMLSTGAFNALLKTLEEPPAHVAFILATTEIHKVPETIISRCQRFDFSRISLGNIIKKLSKIAEKEGVDIEKEAMEIIAISSEGGMRDAESLLAQIISLEDKKITAKEVQEILGTTRHESVENMTELILNKNTSSCLSLLGEIAKAGYDLEIFHRSLLNYIRQLMLISVSDELSESFSFELTGEQLKKLKNLSSLSTTRDLVMAIEILSKIKTDIKSSFIPQLPIEIALVKITKNIDTSSPKTPTTKTNESPVKHSAPLAQALEEEDMDANAKGKPSPTPEPEKKETDVKPNGKKIDIYEIKKIWKDACKQIGTLNHSLATVLPNCIVAKVEDNIVTIATKYSFYKDKLNEMSNKLTVEEVLDKILETQVKVRALTEEEAGVKIPTQKSKESESENQEIEKKTSSLLSDAAGIMGGTIVE